MSAVKVTRRQVAAAKLRLALDQQQGRTSDEWTTRVAHAKPTPKPTGKAASTTAG